MKSRDATIRAKRFEADEKARKVADLEQMIREFETVATDLERQILAEEDRTGVRDRQHFAYSTFAKSAAQRRNNLLASIANLMTKREAALADRDAALSQLTRAEPEGREGATGRSHPSRIVDAQLR